MKILGVSLLSFICISFSLQAYGSIGKVVFSMGEVTRIHRGEELPLKKGEEIFHGDTIVTQKKSVALVKLVNKDATVTSVVKILQNSKMRLKMLRDVASANVSIGGLIVHVTNKLKTEDDRVKFKLRTRTASLGVRGTKFFSCYGPEHSTVTTVDEGVVRIKGKGSNRLSLKAGMGTSTNSKGRLIKPRELKLRKIINWNMNNETGSLFQDLAVFKEINKAWSKYKDEQEFRYKEYKKDLKKKLNIMRNSDDMKQKLFSP